ncbi:MAG: glycosyl hydrolase [Phototrophicales bacterium]|nr:MAG: glycosyl hydrolase [Phototrophicales bacterium]
MSTDTIILGTRKGLILIEYDGQGSRLVHEAFPAQNVSHAMHDPRNDTMWACLDHGHWGTKLHRSRDGGETWEEIPAPKYPDGAAIGRNAMDSDAPNTPAVTTYLWIVTPGGDDQPNRIYIGTEPGGLFMSDNGGDSFEFVESLWNHSSREKWWFGGGRDHAGLCSIIVDPRDNNHLTIGISVGGVYESIDGGQTWQGRNTGLKANYLPKQDSEYGHDPHYMIASPSNPDVLWQQNHCGVFRSVDCGQTWTDISQPGGPVFFGFAIAVDEHYDQTAWVVPAVSDEHRVAVDRALCVCRTDDGGQTWHDFRTGLPQQNCYDVVFRHALDITGDRPAFGTTTGNVYLSDDRGETWHCISNNLPPVHSVRFVENGK